MPRTPRWSLVLLAAVALLATSAGPTRGMGEILGQTKEELKLGYEVVVHDHGNGRATFEFTLADDGRLKPIVAVELSVPAEQKDKNGGYAMDLSVTLELKPTTEGKRVARFEMRKDWAERAEVWLTTNTFDGKPLVMTRYHHLIPLAKYLKAAPAVPATPSPAPPAAGHK